MRAPVGGREQRRAFGEIEGVAVPMENGHGRAVRFEMAQRGSASRLGQRERRPAEFRLARRIHPRAERPRDELRPETDAERRQTGRDALFEHREQRREMGIVGVFVRADRPAEHDEQRRIERIGRIDAPAPDVEIAHEMTAIAEDVFETAQIFEIDVANRQDFMFHRRHSVGRLRVARHRIVTSELRLAARRDRHSLTDSPQPHSAS